MVVVGSGEGGDMSLCNYFNSLTVITILLKLEVRLLSTNITNLFLHLISPYSVFISIGYLVNLNNTLNPVFLFLSSWTMPLD